jgi:hypothetical protein
MVSTISVMYAISTLPEVDPSTVVSPVLNDDYDFLSRRNELKNQIKHALHLLVFSGFPYILLVYIAIYSFSANGHGLSDLFTSVYLFFALYYVINFRKLFTQNARLLRSLRIYNLLVLLSIVAFQAPVFRCPAVEQGKVDGSSYITNKQCVAL